MAIGLESFDAAGSATTAGVFIPVSDLPGVSAAELATAESQPSKEAKFILAALTALTAALASASPLGVSAAQGNNSNSGANVIGLNYTLSWSKLVDLGADSVSVIPLPVSGANAGVGGMSIMDVFPNAEKVGASGAVGGAGVVVHDSALATYGASAPTVNAGDDDRKWFSALFDHLSDADVRETGVVASAITSSSLGAVGSSAIPANYYAATDPIAGIVESDLPKLGLVTRSLTIQVQVQLNQSTQSFDVVVA